MTYTSTHLKRWELPECYVGELWPNYYSSGFGQSRDSDALERSNFRCALAQLGGETDTVTVVREGHWAVGWVEWIAIHQDDEDALRIADRLQEKMQGYPVLDEEDWSNEEHEEANEIWRNCYTPAERIRYIREHSSQFEFVDLRDMLECVRGKCFAGFASDLIR
jgi:hypothetical protein